MSDDNNATNYALCLKAMRGDEVAVRFLELITEILHLWDDLQDKDKHVSTEAIATCFWNALIELPRNPFYVRNFAALNTTLSVAILNWHAANEMEATTSDYDKEIAFIIRSSYVDLVILCATIVGGYAWAREITPEIRRFWHNETLAGYKMNLQEEQSLRSENHARM